MPVTRFVALSSTPIQTDAWHVYIGSVVMVVVLPLGPTDKGIMSQVWRHAFELAVDESLLWLENGQEKKERENNKAKGINQQGTRTQTKPSSLSLFLGDFFLYPHL
jgi:hypothetical protein